MCAMINKKLKYTPPDKGSFPLDHDGICKKLMCEYMNCLYKNDQKSSLCRQEIKAYLDCRMNNNLMAQEPWKKLGLAEEETQEEPMKKIS